MVEHFAPKYSHKCQIKSSLRVFFISAVASALSFLLPPIEMSCSPEVAIAEFPALGEGKIAASHIYIYVYKPTLWRFPTWFFPELMFACPEEYKHHWDFPCTGFKCLNPLWSLGISRCSVNLHPRRVCVPRQGEDCAGESCVASVGGVNFVIQFSINTLRFAFPEPADISVVSKCNPCLSRPCKNNGTCANDPVEFYQCTCPFGFKVWLQLSYRKSTEVLHTPSVSLIVVPREDSFRGNWARRLRHSGRLCVTFQLRQYKFCPVQSEGRFLFPVLWLYGVSWAACSVWSRVVGLDHL